MPEIAFEIRPYRESDEAAVIGLWNIVFPDPSPWNDPATVIAEKLATHRDLFLVGLLDGEPVGTAMGGYDGHRGWVYLAAVAPEHQRVASRGARMHETQPSGESWERRGGQLLPRHGLRRRRPHQHGEADSLGLGRTTASRVQE